MLCQLLLSYVLVVIVHILRHLLTSRKLGSLSLLWWCFFWLSTGGTVSWLRSPEYYAAAKPFLSSEEITATAFFNVLSWIQCVLCKWILTHGTAQGLRHIPKRDLCCLCVCTWFPLYFHGIQEVHGVSRENEQDGDDDKDAEVLWLGCRDDHDEVQQVHQVVHGALDSIHHPTLWFTYGLLQELSHCQVKGPETWKTTTRIYYFRLHV